METRTADEYDYIEFADYDDDAPSALASGFGFYSQREFDDYCDEQNRSAMEDMNS
jgi:hypothetical protein